MHSKKKISTNQPIQYQRGFAEFYKLKFMVDERVLIPRPETELLVEQVIRANPTNVLEVGTGSGCIAVALARNLPKVKIKATDISGNALAVARKNAELHRVKRQITFIKGDLLSPFSLEDNLEVDWIVANLPYVPSSRITTLDSSVKDFEPHLALDGGEDGFELYRKLFLQMIEKNIYPLYFLGEIDISHVEIAKKEAEKFFPKASVEISIDLTKRPRFLVIHF